MLNEPEEFKDFFTKYGEVKEHMIMRDHETSRSRGFGFITFDTEESVDNILSNGNRIELAGAQVSVDLYIISIYPQQAYKQCFCFIFFLFL